MASFFFFFFFFFFSIIIKKDAPFNRKQLQVYLEKNIQTRVVFTGNIVRQPCFKKLRHKYRASDYPNADQVMIGGMLLGCHQGLDIKKLDYLPQKLLTL